MGAEPRWWTQGVAAVCVAVFAVACSASGESAGDEPAPATAVQAPPAPTTTTEPPARAIQVGVDGVLGELTPAVLDEVDAGVDGLHRTNAAGWCDLDAAVLAIPADEPMPDGCERFDRAAAVSATTITGVWTSTPTACLTVETLVDIFATRPQEVAVVESSTANHLDIAFAGRGHDPGLMDAATALTSAPDVDELAAAPARFLVALDHQVDARADGLWEVLIDAGEGCAAPTPAEVIAGRYPFGIHWHVIAAVDAPPAVEAALDELEPELEAAQAPPPPVDPRYERPDWLGTPLTELRPGSNHGVAQPTPPELRDRQLATVDIFPLPRADEYHFTISAVPPEVLPRSTFSPACPVGLDDLRYLTMTFWGFDQRPHIGEMIVNARIADQTVEIFGELYFYRPFFALKGLFKFIFK